MNGSRLLGEKVLSIHVGGPIGQVGSMVFDPNDLKISAFKLTGSLIKPGDANLLESRSVREFSNLGMIVDSADELVKQGEILALEEVMRLNFEVNGLKVESEKGAKIGRVVDFLVDENDFRILKLIVKRPIMKALMDPELVIDRSEITEVTDTKIIIKDENAGMKKENTVEKFMPNFVNPFRERNLAPKQNLAPADSQNLDAPDTE